MEVSEKIRSNLKDPLGPIISDSNEIIARCKGHRIITIGDICSLTLIRLGLTPHVAVFDFRTKRNEISNTDKKLLEDTYPEPKKYKNPPGTLSSELINDAQMIIQKGGGIFIDGEEDLTALAFILPAKSTDRVVYGQPDQGLVILEPNEKIKNKIRDWLKDEK